TVALRPMFVTLVTVPVNGCAETRGGDTQDATAGGTPTNCATPVSPTPATRTTTTRDSHLMAIGRRGRVCGFPAFDRVGAAALSYCLRAPYRVTPAACTPQAASQIWSQTRPSIAEHTGLGCTTA